MQEKEREIFFVRETNQKLSHAAHQHHAVGFCLFSAGSVVLQLFCGERVELFVIRKDAPQKKMTLFSVERVPGIEHYARIQLARFSFGRAFLFGRMFKEADNFIFGFSGLHSGFDFCGLHFFGWRRGRDSNPGTPFGVNALAVRSIRPLWHLSSSESGCGLRVRLSAFTSASARLFLSNFCLTSSLSLFGPSRNLLVFKSRDFGFVPQRGTSSSARFLLSNVPLFR